MGLIKDEYLLPDNPAEAPSSRPDDDEAEARTGGSEPVLNQGQKRKKGGRGGRDKQKGQNTERNFGSSNDAIKLCNSRALYPEFSPRECRFGDRCKLSHDLRKYLHDGRRQDLDTFGGKCPVFQQYGRCASGWKCRFVGDHMKELEHADGRKELVLVTGDSQGGPTNGRSGENGADEAEGTDKQDGAADDDAEDSRPGIFNIVDKDIKFRLYRKKVDFSHCDKYAEWLAKEAETNRLISNRRKEDKEQGHMDPEGRNQEQEAREEGNEPISESKPPSNTSDSVQDKRAEYLEAPFKPSEKRRIYFGPETPTLAPLTTQGNLPFRRLCVDLGAQLTYSEMALSLPLIQGTRADWTLLKAHESEMSPPRIASDANVPAGYDHEKDMRFGAQIAANNQNIAIKAADALGRFCPQLRLIDLNCGCPIDMVFKSGGGSGLLDNHGKLERMVRGMNAVSGEIPITAKLRMGVKTGKNTAPIVIEKLAFGAREHRDRIGAPGCAAITLHGRSREQRYTRKADWGYIGECAALVKTYNEQRDALTDTASGMPDPSTQANTGSSKGTDDTSSSAGRIFFLGNGDCYSHEEYRSHIEQSRVDSVMIGRGALIKPWLFEEIEKGQYLDKSSSERLGYVEKFVRYGLEAWGSDEVGIGFTRRFLLEWLSFTRRYIPVGLLERLPPDLNDRPPRYRGRDEMETLLASDNYKDWIKISEMFLGPVHPDFRFQPKHKSNAYEPEG